MSERTIWIVRIIAAAVFLLLAYLLLDLHSELRKMQEPRAASSASAAAH